VRGCCGVDRPSGGAAAGGLRVETRGRCAASTGRSRTSPVEVSTYPSGDGGRSGNSVLKASVGPLQGSGAVRLGPRSAVEVPERGAELGGTQEGRSPACRVSTSWRCRQSPKVQEFESRRV